MQQRKKYFDGTPENVLSQEGISRICPLLPDSQWKFLLCLGLRGAVGAANCPLLQAAVNVKHGPT